MNEIKNKTMIDSTGHYTKPLIFNQGLIVTRTFAPREYIKKDGKKSDAWLPEIRICEANKDSPVKVRGRVIIAKSPAKIVELFFMPDYNGKKSNEIDNIIYKFEKAFIPEEKNEIGDILVYKHNSTGRYDSLPTPGQIVYSDVDKRDIALHGSQNELEKMILFSASNFPSINYDLAFNSPCCAAGHKKCLFKISKEEISLLAKKVAEEF